MSGRRKRTHQELEQLLREQLQFLRSSADAFDGGFEGEAKRLALTIRVLLHDTKRSKSLLGQLAQVPDAFVDTALPDEPGNIGAYHGLVGVQIGAGPGGYVAMLDDTLVRRSLSFDEWWSAPVFRDGKGDVLSRRDLVLVAANQDGGAHVDPSLDETYARLTKDNSMGWNVV